MRKYICSLLPLVVILAATFLSYSKLIFRNIQGVPNYIIKWDAFNFMYPRLIFNSDSFKSFIFPMWNPYQYGGIPWVSNFQACLFHPINLIIIFFKGYSLELLQFQMFITFFIAGAGMYYCLRYFSLSKTACLIGSVCFLGCGFFVGNGGHFPQMNTLAFLPLSFLSVNIVLKNMNLYTLAWGVLALTLLAFCGYPSMLVSSVYMLFLFGVLRIFFIDKDLRRKIVCKKVIYLFAFFMLGICASALLLVPGLEHASYSVRGPGVSFENITRNSLSFIYLSTFWYPFLSIENLNPKYLDVTLRNCSIGIIGLFFAIYFLFFNRTRLKWALLLLLLVGLILLLGTNTPLYIPLVKIIPFIKHVRHPAMDYRAIFLFLLCLTAGFGVQEMLNDKEKYFKKGLITLSVILSIACLIYFQITFAYGLEVINSDKQSVFILLFIFFFLGITIFSRKMSTKRFCIILVAFCILDVSYWVQTNFGTVVTEDRSNKWLVMKFLELSRNKKVDHKNVFKRNAESYPISFKANLEMVLKRFSNSGYDPLILRHYDEFFKTPNRNIITENFRIMPIYNAILLPDEQSVLLNIAKKVDLHKVAIINISDIKNEKLLQKLKKLSFSNNDFSAEITMYTPNYINYNIKVTSPTLIFFNEIYYPGWCLFSMGNKIDLFRINHAFRGTYLEPGEYNLKMVFSPTSFKIGITISILCFLFILFSIVTHQNKRQKSEKNNIEVSR